MIKLIATDMDGTLLNDKKELPAELFEVIERLSERGISLAVASGRTFDAVSHLFPSEYHSKLDFICDNGANIYHSGRHISVKPLEREVFEQLIKACDEIGGLRVLVCAARGTYHLRADKEFDAEVAKFYKNHFPCDNLLDIDDVIYKVAVCDPQGAEQRAKPAVDAILGDKLNVQVSGPIWMDIMAAGVNKGSALKTLGEILGIKPQETMAFGDYFNDIEMLKYAGYSFAMANAHDEVKKTAKFLTAGNNENGVIRAINEHIFELERV